MNIKKTAFSTLIAVLVISSMVATPAMAAGGIGWSGDSAAPNPQISADVTVDEWNGSDFSEALQYYDDSGEAAQLPASVNASNDNPITLTATDIAFEQRDEFPRKDDETGENSASALDASEWTTSGATVSSTTTAPSVSALNYAGSASSDSATYSNFSVTDGEKGYLTIAADINSASGTPTLQVTDGDGDYVEVTLYDSGASAVDDTVLANSTGEGMVLQEQVGDLTVQGGGDGTFDSAEEITISGDVDADISVLDAERTRELTFGERLVENDDGELETEMITEPHGAYSVANMDGFDEVMSDATIYGLTVDAMFQASDLQDAENVNAEFSQDNDYPQWDSVGSFEYRMKLPTAFDLSYSNTEFVDEPDLPGERYKSVEIAEDVGDTEFADIESWSDVTSSFGSSEVTLDSTVSSGTVYAVSYDVVLTSGEVSAIQSAAGGGAGPMDTANGGLWDKIISIPGGIIAAVLGIFGINKFGGGS
ncbi:hypothetical protein DJ73_02200 [Halorubrum sp. Ea1]|uniref:hypothetical protein n=1 Tax=Halorubrum sp. Ea1 TaxID=1480718 RepID=UPI000B98D0E3|nr:hypothetical protein [Halorubrum sp. Ea1]OYR55532.1 hypothetical protein DJ73_02200 [Halorubrum sp. Ea1]